MKWMLLGATLSAFLAVAVLTSTPVGAGNQTPTAKDIMGKLHKGSNAPLATLARDLNADEIDWSEVQKKTKDFATLGETLTKTTPPKGDKDSWTKLTKQYAEETRTMDDAAKKKDKDATATARKKLTESCAACHRVHRE